MSDVVHIDIVTRLKQAAEMKAAADPALVRRLLLPGASALLGAGAGALLSRGHDDEALSRARNTSFGAGIATGMAGPQIIDALHAAMHPAPAPMQEQAQ